MRLFGLPSYAVSGGVAAVWPESQPAYAVPFGGYVVRERGGRCSWNKPLPSAVLPAETYGLESTQRPILLHTCILYMYIHDLISYNVLLQYLSW